MRTPKGKRRLLVGAVVGAAAITALGFSVPAAMADTNSDKEASHHVANAELGDPKCGVPAEHDPAVTQQVYAVAKDRGVTDKVLLAAFEAGWVESHMNNLNCGDSDSLGVFQQRPSMGWCDPADLCMDVPHATNAFLDQAIPNDANNPGYSAGELAQSVQRSAYPGRYDESEGKANELIAGEAG